jgi:hypothetical protein
VLKLKNFKVNVNEVIVTGTTNAVVVRPVIVVKVIDLVEAVGVVHVVKL